KYVNSALAGEYQTLFSKIDLLMLLQAPSFDVVYDWRHEQQQELRKRIASAMEYAMTGEELEYFIAHYERLTRWILEEMPNRADVVIRMDEQRNVVDCTRRGACGRAQLPELSGCPARPTARSLRRPTSPRP